MVKVVLGIVLLAHGIGHLLGLLPIIGFAPTKALPNWDGQSWILPRSQAMLGHILSGVLWLASMLGFIALAFVLFGWLPVDWWQPLALGASLTSIVAVVLFPAGFPTVVNVVGALVVDVVVLGATILNDWSPTMLDS